MCVSVKYSIVFLSKMLAYLLLGVKEFTTFACASYFGGQDGLKGCVNYCLTL